MCLIALPTAESMGSSCATCSGGHRAQGGPLWSGQLGWISSTCAVHACAADPARRRDRGVRLDSRAQGVVDRRHHVDAKRKPHPTLAVARSAAELLPLAVPHRRRRPVGGWRCPRDWRCDEPADLTGQARWPVDPRAQVATMGWESLAPLGPGGWWCGRRERSCTHSQPDEMFGDGRYCERSGSAAPALR